jgi:hypothetical protein
LQPSPFGSEEILIGSADKRREKKGTLGQTVYVITENPLTNVNGSGINLNRNIFKVYLEGSYPGLSTQKTLDPDSDLIKGSRRARRPCPFRRILSLSLTWANLVWGWWNV